MTLRFIAPTYDVASGASGLVTSRLGYYAYEHQIHNGIGIVQLLLAVVQLLLAVLYMYYLAGFWVHITWQGSVYILVGKVLVTY